MPTPQPGDAVIAFHQYEDRMRIGVIDSDKTFADEDRLLVVFGASAFRQRTRPEVVSCSGGPCPFIPADKLTLVGQREQRFWEWKNRPRAHGGVDYTETVNLWSYNGGI